MFPITNDTPYRNNKGELTNMGRVVGGGDTPELPEYSIADAGKVLTVNDDGDLEWNEKGGAGGVYVGTDNPTSDIGENGDYYYKRSNQVDWLNSATFTNYSNQQYYGNEFVAKTPYTITHIGGMLHKSLVGKLQIGDLAEVLAVSGDIEFTADEWAWFELPEPIELDIDDHFIIEFNAVGSGHVPYNQSGSSYVGNTNIAEYVKGRYGAPYPGTADNNTRVAVSFKYENPDGFYLVTDQYVKQSNLWVKIG